MKKILSIVLTLAIVLGTVGVPVFAEEVEVTTSQAEVTEASEYAAYVGETGYDSLQGAIDAAEAGATVLLMADVEKMPIINKHITIIGSEDDYVDFNVVIAENFADIEGTVTFQYINFNKRISTEYSSTDQSKLTLKFVDCNFNISEDTCAIQGGSTGSNPDDLLGGLVVQNCTFTTADDVNVANYMIYAQCVENLIVENCTFNGNDTTKGAIHTGDSDEYATNATITGSTIGGVARGIQIGNRVENSSVSVSGVTFDHVTNAADDKSGAIYIHSNADEDVTVSAANNTFTGCTQVLYNDGNTTDGDNITGIIDSFTGNTADGSSVEINESGEITTAGSGETAPEEIIGSVTPAYVSTDSNTPIWGEGGGNAGESLEFKLFENGNEIAVTKLNNVGGIIDGDVYVTWSFFVKNADEYWTTEWAEGYPKASMNPDTVKVYVDGVEAATNEVQYNAPDDLNKIVAAAEKNGTFLGYYTTLADAMGKFNSRTVYVLRDVEESIDGFYGVTLTTNVEGGISITDTNTEDWIDFDDVTVDKGVMVNIPNVFSGDSENLILGTLNVGETYYHGYDAKTTIKDGGKVTVGDSTILRYNTAEDAGIYIYGDGDNSTIEFDCDYYIGAYSGTFYVDNANVKAGYFLLKNSYDDSTYADIDMTLDESELTIKGTIDGQDSFIIDDQAHLTLKNNSSIENVRDFNILSGANLELSVDETSSISATNISVAEDVPFKAVENSDGTFGVAVKVTEVSTYDELVAALANGGEIKLTADITVDTAINVIDGTIIDMNGHTIYLNVENSYFGDATIKNEVTDEYGYYVGGFVLGKDDVHVCDGYFLVNAGKTLKLSGMNVTSSEVGFKGYAVFHLKDGANLKLDDCIINVANNEYAGSIFYAGDLNSKITMNYVEVTGENTGRGFVNGDVEMTYCYITIKGTTENGLEHGFNGSNIVVNDSDITISGGTGRGISLGRSGTSSMTVNGDSDIVITDMDEASIKLYTSTDTLTVADTATVTVDAEITNDVGATIVGENNITVTVSGLSGEGTEEDPYLINNLAELQWFRDDVNNGNNYEGKFVKLGADIDLESEEWTPIGNTANKFSGIFDGDNHTISNLVITGSNSNVGLFGFTCDGTRTQSVIKNLTVNKAKVSGRLNVGVVAGTPYTTEYSNIKLTGHVEVNGMAYVGGVFGKNVYANLTDITVNVDATSYVNAVSTENGTAYRTYVGGVIGFMGEGGHVIKGVTSNINVTGDVCDVGGITGIAHYGNIFENVTCSGTVTNTSTDPEDAAETGGIAGVWHNAKGYTVTFTKCEYTGTSDVSIVGAAYTPSNSTEDTSGTLIIDGTKAWPVVVAVAQIGDVKYTDLQSAIDAAQDGETINILSGTISEGTIKLPATLENVTIKSEEGAVLKDMTISAADGNSLDYDGIIFDGITFDNSRILITGWRSDGVDIKNLTITNCIFKNLYDETNSAPVHINVDEKEAIENFTFTNNVIDGATGGQKSGIYMAATGNVTVTGNTFNNIVFRPALIQLADCDGTVDNVVVSDNVISNTTRLQIYGSEEGPDEGPWTPSGTDTLKIAINKNIFKNISGYYICTWGINGEADIAENYYDTTDLGERIYWNNEKPTDEAGLAELGIYPIYTELNEDGTINLESEYTYVPKPTGDASIAYIKNDRIYGEATGNASKSWVMKVLDANGNVMGTTSLNNIGGIIDGDVTVTWNLLIDAESNDDEYWTMEWTAAPTADNIPASVELWIDGVPVDTGVVKLNRPDDSYPVIAAVTDDNGVVESFVCANGYTNNMKDVAASLAAAITKDANVVLLRDVKLESTIKVRDKSFNLNGNGHTISGNGGLWLLSGSYDIKNVTFDNITNSDDYGVLEFTYAEANVTDCTFSNNNVKSCIAVDTNAAGDGNSEVTIDGCTFTGNTCSTSVINSAEGSTTVKNSAITGNTASIAVIYNSADCNVTGNVFSDNTLIGENANKAVILSGPWVEGNYNVSITENAFLDADYVSAYIENWAEEYNAVSTNVLNSNYWLDGDAPVAGKDYVFENDVTATLDNYYTKYNEDGTLGDLISLSSPVAQIGDVKYIDLQEAFKAAADGDEVVLLKDVTLDSNIVVSEKNITFDGNGFTIRQAEGLTLKNYAAGLRFDGDSSDITKYNYTIKNVTFDGWTTRSVLAIHQCTAAVDNVTINGTDWDSNVQAMSYGLLYLENTDITVENSKFTNNNAEFVITYNYGSPNSTAKFKMDECVVENNTVGLNAAAVYYVTGSECTITNTEFVGNNVTTGGNGATLYLGFQENCTVENCLFKDNVVNSKGDSKRVAGAIFFGYEADITNNAFVNNSATNANNDVLGQSVCTSTYYDCKIDLSNNYFDGREPVEGVDYYVQHKTGDATFELSTYNTEYTLDEDGNVVLSGEETIEYVAAYGTAKYTTVQAAVDSAAEEATVTLLCDAAGDGVVVYKDITIDLAGFTYTVDGETVGSANTKTNGFQLMKDKNITIKNGTIASTKAKMLIQNYSNLTLEDVTLDADDEGSAAVYVLSNNNGAIKLTGETNIYAPDGKIAFDLYYWPSGGYGAVSVESSTTGKVRGNIVVSGDAGSDIANNATLAISNGTYTVPIEEAWCAEGFEPVDNGDGTYGVQIAEEKELIKFTSFNTKLGNALSLFFFLLESDMTDTGSYAVVTHTYADGREAVVKTIPYSEWKKVTYNKKQQVRFEFGGIAAKEMSDNINVVVYNSADEVISESLDTSIEDYIERALVAYKDDAELRTALVDMANYGAAAQTAFDYNKDNLANSNLTEEQKAWATSSVEYDGSYVKGDNFKTLTLMLRDNIILNFYFTNLNSDCYAEISYTNHNNHPVNYRVESSDITNTTNGWQIPVNTLTVADYQTPVTCKVYNSDGSVIGNATCSMATYCKAAGNNITDSIIKFASSTYAYLH